MSSYLSRMGEELAKAEPDIEVLKVLDKELTIINNKAVQFNTALRGLTLPTAVSEEVKLITKQIINLTNKIEELKTKNISLSSGLDLRTKTGYKKGSKEEEQSFQKVGASVEGIEEFRDKYNLLGGTYDQIKTKIEAVVQATKGESEEKSKLLQLLSNIQSAMKSQAQALDQEITKNEENIKATRKKVAELEEDKKAKIENAKATQDLTEREAQFNEQVDANAASITASRVQQEKTSDALQEQLKNSNVAIKQNTVSLDINANSAIDNNKAQTGLIGNFRKAATQVFTYGSTLKILRTVYNRTINTVKAMDKALTDMTVVTSLSRKEAYELVGTFTSLAQETGKTTAEIANITTKFLQQGKSVSQAITLTEAAAKAATIAGISGEKSVDLLTNALNGFQLSASQAMDVSDKFAALAAASATDYEELAVALSKVAAQANLAGLSMDFTLGLLAKGVETTRKQIAA